MDTPAREQVQETGKLSVQLAVHVHPSDDTAKASAKLNLDQDT